MNYKIRPLFLGSKEGDKSDSLYLYPQGEKYTACYCCYLVEGEGAKYLVDAGLPEPSCIQDKPFAKLKDAVSLREALL